MATRGILQRPILLLIILGAVIIGSCSDDDPTEPDTKTVSEFISAISPYPDPPEAFTTAVGSPEDTTVTTGQGMEICTKQDYEMGRNLDQVMIFNPNTSGLWPGCVIQGRYLTDGILSGVAVERSPCTIGVPGLPGMTVEELSETVDTPDQFSSAGAINRIVEDFLEAGHTLPAKFDFEMSEANSFSQAMLDIGVSVSWTGGNLQNDFSYSQTRETHTIFVKFIQEYFTASVNDPSSPDAFFDGVVTAEDLNNYTGNGNPLCYMSSVTYGRIGLLSMASSYSHTEMKNALSLALDSIDKQGEIDIGTQYEEILTESQIKLKVIGGQPTDGVISLTNPLEGLVQWIKDGMVMTAQSRGAPIWFTARHLKDNSLARFQYTTDFSQLACVWADQEVVVTLDYMKCIDDEEGAWPALEIYYDFDVQTENPDVGPKSYDIDTGSRMDFDEGEIHTFSNKSSTFYVTKQTGSRFRIFFNMTEDDDFSANDELDAYSPWFEAPYFNPGTGSYSARCDENGQIVDVYYTVELR